MQAQAPPGAHHTWTHACCDSPIPGPHRTTERCLRLKQDIERRQQQLRREGQSPNVTRYRMAGLLIG